MGHIWRLGVRYKDEYILKLLNKAYSLGINFFDTAAVYGNGRSERYLSNLKNVIISTKLPAMTKPIANVRNFNIRNYFLSKKTRIIKRITRIHPILN